MELRKGGRVTAYEARQAHYFTFKDAIMAHLLVVISTVGWRHFVIYADETMLSSRLHGVGCLCSVAM